MFIITRTIQFHSLRPWCLLNVSWRRAASIRLSKQTTGMASDRRAWDTRAIFTKEIAINSLLAHYLGASYCQVILDDMDLYIITLNPTRQTYMLVVEEEESWGAKTLPFKAQFSDETWNYDTFLISGGRWNDGWSARKVLSKVNKASVSASSVSKTTMAMASNPQTGLQWLPDSSPGQIHSDHTVQLVRCKLFVPLNSFFCFVLFCFNTRTRQK